MSSSCVVCLCAWLLQMLKALALCGASLDDYLHLLVPPIVKVFESSYPFEVRK